MKNRIRRLPMAVTLCLCGQLHAQADDQAVVVTASRTPQTIGDALAAVTVITRDDIIKQQANSVPELLSRVAGIDIATQGGRGKLTSVYLRGTNPGHVLVLVDGVPLGSATAGTSRLELIPVAHIERIEVVRGPRSSLYGSEAIGGVIHIFTGSPRETLSGGATLGSYNTRGINASTTLQRERLGFYLSAFAESSDGFNAKKPTTGPFAINEPDDDGYREQSLATGLGYTFGNDVKLDLTLMRSEGDIEFDGFINSSDTVQQVARAALDLPLSERLASTLTVGETRDEADNFSDGVYSSTFDTKRRHASWQLDFGMSDETLLTAGIDYQRDNVASTTAYSSLARDNSGVFAQIQNERGALQTIISLRHDDNDQFGTKVTGNLTFGYTLDDKHRLTAAYGTGFKAPTFNDLYWPNDGFFTGNPDLKPEESASVEFGFIRHEANATLDVRIFQNDIDELIVYEFTTIGTMNNVNRARIRGAELAYSRQVAGHDITLSATFLDPRDRATEKLLPRRARRALSADVARTWGRLGGGLAWHVQDHSFDDTANATPIAGYGVLDARLSYQITKRLDVALKGENLFDKDYETVATYNSPGRSGYVSLRYRD